MDIVRILNILYMSVKTIDCIFLIEIKIIYLSFIYSLTFIVINGLESLQYSDAATVSSLLWPEVKSLYGSQNLYVPRGHYCL